MLLIPMLVVAVIGGFAVYRHWHLRWGATPDEATASMPGDELIPRARFQATRAITIDAPPVAVWPWIVQIGFGKAGFYSYDLLDNLGRRSADRIIPEYQAIAVGDLAAPMASPPTERNSFRVAEFEEGRMLVWAKPGSTWSWRLTPQRGGTATRLVTRLKEEYRGAGAVLSVPLMEIGDFPMMRRQLLGIRDRAEKGGRR